MIAALLAKWWPFLCLSIPTTFSIVLLVASVRDWPFSTGASEYIRDNRTTVQLIIQLVSAVLALVHSLAVCRLISYGGRIHLAGKQSITMGQLRGWGSMAAPRIELSVPLVYLTAASLLASLSIASSALWVGAMTPVESNMTADATLDLPAFDNTSLIYEYASEADLVAPQVYTQDGLFSYSVGIRYISFLMSSAASATTADGSTRKHAKGDNTQFAYNGRSYGTGAAVGIKDEDIGAGAGGRVVGYEYVETGYETLVSCIYNATSDFRIRDASRDWIYPVKGWLPDSGSEETSDYFGRSPDAIVALGKRFVAIAAGRFYEALDTVQCEVDFVPRRFSVAVVPDSRNISVAVVKDDDVEDMEPTMKLTSTLMRQFQIASNDLTNLYVSVLGDALLSSVMAWNAANNPNGTVSEDEATLRGVENALVAMADDMLALYGAAQLMVGNFSQPTTATVTVAVMAIGKWQYAVAVAVVNAVIVVAAVAEIFRTRGWRGLPAFDYTNQEWLMLASFRGGTINAGGGQMEVGVLKEERGSLLQVHESDEGGVETVGGKDVDIELKQLEDRNRSMALIIRGYKG